MMRYLLPLFALFSGVPAVGATYTVSTAADLVNYINLNNGLAGGGTVIILNAGTYNLNSTVRASQDPNIAIDIVQPITIQAARGAAPVLSMSTYLGIRVQASNSVLDGLTLSGAHFGVQVQDVSSLNAGTVSNTILRRLSVSTTATDGQAISGGGMLDSIIEYCTVTSTYNAGISLSPGPAPSNSGSNRNLIVNNSVNNATAGQGIALTRSDYNTIAGNTVTDVGSSGILVTGGQHNYVGQNTLLRPGNGIVLSLDQPTRRQSNRNYVGNNLMTLNAKPGTDALWFDYDSDYNMGFLNEGSGANEAGMSLFNSVGNYVRANNFHNNPNGGIVVLRDAGSGTTTPTRNSFQQNYLHDHPANGGITTAIETLNDFGFNYIAGTPATAGQPIAGLLLQGSMNSSFYSNIIRDLLQAEQIQDVVVSGTDYFSSGDIFFLNRHVNTTNHYLFTGSTSQFDSGSSTLGGNYYSDFSSANGNPSNGATPYTNYINQVPQRVAQDNYPYASESLGKNYSVNVRLPSAGSSLPVGSSKTISWLTQGCILVDLYLLNADGSINSTIAANTPDYGYYRWRVPSVTPAAYEVRVDCKTAAGNPTGKSSAGPAFSITPPDLVLLSPQSNLVIDSGLRTQISWSKTAAIGPVDVYIRYADAQSYALVQSGVTADYLTITTPTVTSNKASVRIVSGGYGDSTDGWFTIRGSSSGTFTRPASTDNLYVGTPYLVEWIAPQTTDYVNIDLVGNGTKNIVTQLADFSNYQMLVPDLQGTGTVLRLTFYTAAGTVLQQISSPALSVVPSSSQPNAIAAAGGSGQAAAVNTAFGTALQVTVTNSVGAGIAGVAVTFTPPGSGASGSFSGSNVVVTNGGGIATGPTFTANGTTGSYTVTATAGSLSTLFTLTNTAGTLGRQTNVGYFYNSYFVLDANGNGQFDTGDKLYFYVTQQPGDIAITGDWNGSGTTKVGIYRNGFWILDYNGNGVYDNDGTAANDKFYAFGGSGTQYVPVTGDWNGDGRTKIGYYVNGFWALDYNGSGSFDSGDKFFALGGNAGEFPIIGDWNHDGRAKAGFFYNGTFVLDYAGDEKYTSNAKIYNYVSYLAGDRPVIGDWSGNGFSKIGVYRKGFWILDYNGNGVYDGPSVDKFYALGGNTGEMPIVGDWSGSGTTKIGYYLNGFWLLDFNGNGTYDGSGPGFDRFIAFGGNSGEQPLIGRW